MNISFSRVSRALFLLPLLVVGIFSFGIRAQAFSGAGDGLFANTAFIITTCAQLQEMNDNLSAYYKLGNDIDCSATATWNSNSAEWVDGVVGGTLIPDAYTAVTNNGYAGFNPIGRDAIETNGFTGTLDGQGHTISNLWIFRKLDNFVGLFGYANGATISNTVLENARIVGGEYTGGFVGQGNHVTLSDLTNTSGMERAYLSFRGGGIVGGLYDSSTITDAVVDGGTVHGSGNIIGGLVGEMTSSTVTDSTTSANIDGGEHIGGAFGSVSTSTITNVHATGNVVSNSNENDYVFIVKTGNYTGGFAGYVVSSAITESYATGSVTAAGDYTGGFAGYVSNGSIGDSYATGDVSGHGLVGGFVGYNEGAAILNAYATGDVTGIVDYAGGFAGISACSATITHAYASGNVTTSGDYVGGFTGADGCEGPGTTYNQTAAHGSVTGAHYVGGFVGQANVLTATNAYASGDVTASDRLGGFAGYASYSTLTHVYSRGAVHAGGEYNFAGGFIGEANNLTSTESFWDGDMAIISDVCATPSECATGVTKLTTTQAKTVSTFTDANWDFDLIWTINSLNSNYPHFRWETFGVTDLPYVLTAITPIPSVVNGTTATYTFAISGTGEAQYMAEMCGGNADGAFTHMADDPDHQVFTLFNLEPGITYECQFAIQSLSGYSNFLHVGPFSVQLTTSSGGGRPWTPAQVQTPVTTVTTSDTCAVDQLLTQNMRAGARNGVYHPYTKAVVREVKILQAHMNRLGFNSGPVDGILGKLTDGAIKRMQKYLGTYQDGLVGPITRSLINKSCGTQGLQKI